jgi:integrase
MSARKDWAPFWDETHGWRVDFTLHGERVRRRLGIREKGLKDIANRAAEQLYRNLWERHLTPAPVKTGTPFWQAAKGYIEAGGEARYLPRLIRYFGSHMMIEEIGEAEIVAAGVTLYAGCAPDTIRRQLRVPVSAVIRWAQGRRRRPSTDVRRTRWLTPEEAERLIAAAAKLMLPRHADPERFTLQKIAFMLGTGVRPGECFAAEVRHWNPATRQWWIPAEIEGAAKTPTAARWVRLPERAVHLIGDLPEVGRAFRTPYGKPIVVERGRGGQMQTSFNAARDAAGLGDDVTPYVLRHTWATWCYAQTRDFGGLMDQGGWAKADMANRYRKIAPDDLGRRLLDHGWDFRSPAFWQESRQPQFSTDVQPVESTNLTVISGGRRTTP